MSDAAPSRTSAAGRAKRQRRPTGAPPPLPRRISRGTTAWLVLATVLVAGAFVAQRTSWLRAGDQAGTWLLRQLAALRTPWLTDLANWINDVVMSWHPVIAVAVVLLTIVFRRWRHLLVLAASLTMASAPAGPALGHATTARPRCSVRARPAPPERPVP